MPTSASAIRFDKFALKFFAGAPETIDLDAVIPIFHRWIQARPIDGLWIDVADYRHVPDGPGVLLIGHETDYFLDRTEGPLGLMHNRKRSGEGSNAERLRADARRVLVACRMLEREPALAERGLRFQGRKLRFILNDRLAATDHAEAVATLRGDLEAMARDLYGGRSFRIEAATFDPRHRIALNVVTAEAVDVETLLERLH